MKTLKLLPVLFLIAFAGFAQVNIGIYPLATASGTDTYTATVTPTFTTYVSGQRFNIKFTNANTGAATININSKGAKSIVKNGASTLSSGDIFAGQILLLVYDGTNMQLIGGGITDPTWIDVEHYLPSVVTLETSTKQQRTDAWQAAIADGQATQRGIKFSGEWDIYTDSLIIEDRLAIVGVGMQSRLTTTDNHGTMLYVHQNTPRMWYNVIFPDRESFIARDFAVQYRGAENPDATSMGIKIAVDTSVTFEHKLENITIDSFYVGLKLHNVGSSQFHKNYFRNNRAYGVLISTSESNDLGKLVFSENTWSTVGPLAGEPDTTAHMKIEGGAGMYLIDNDMYGYTDYGVWMDMRTQDEYFQAWTGSEYMFQKNRIAFVRYYAFLIDSEYGKSGTGAGIDTGNRITGLQIQNNYCTANGLVQTVGGAGSISDVQIQNNMVIYPYNSQIPSPTNGIIPIVLNGSAIRNLHVSDNTLSATVLGALNSYVPTKAISLTGTVTGLLVADGNSAIGFPTTSDLPTLSNLTPDVGYKASGNAYAVMQRTSNATNEIQYILKPAGTLSSSNYQFGMILPANQNYLGFYRYNGTTIETPLKVGGTSSVEVAGSFGTPYVAKTGAYTLTASDYTVAVTSGTHTQTLPTAVGCTGRIYVITNSGTGTVTIGTTSSQTFANVSGTPTTLTLAQFQTKQVQSNGTNWLLIASF